LVASLQGSVITPASGFVIPACTCGQFSVCWLADGATTIASFVIGADSIRHPHFLTGFDFTGESGSSAEFDAESEQQQPASELLTKNASLKQQQGRNGSTTKGMHTLATITSHRREDSGLRAKSIGHIRMNGITTLSHYARIHYQRWDYTQ
jgi:hypothetical protein